MKVSYLIPVYRLTFRGIKRLYWQALSLKQQTVPIHEIIVIIGSNTAEMTIIRDMLRPFKPVIIHKEQPVLNKCELLNMGIWQASGDWLQMSDADFLYRKDYNQSIVKNADNNFLVKEVRKLPKMIITEQKINLWDWPATEPFEYGKEACGCQSASINYFKENPYPEEMIKLNGMDVWQKINAYNQGLEVRWMAESQVLHQYHKISEYKMDREQTAKNQAVIQQLVKDSGKFVKSKNI